MIIRALFRPRLPALGLIHINGVRGIISVHVLTLMIGTNHKEKRNVYF